MSDSVESESPVDFRLTEPEVAKDPGEFFEALQSKCPVAKTSAFDGFWMLSRYGDVHDAAFNPEVFSSASGITIPVLPQPQVLLIEQDDPEHRKYRQPMQGWFTAKRVQALEDQVRNLVTERIDEVIDDGQGDLAEILARQVPPLVIGLLLGLPEEDWHWFRERAETGHHLAQIGDMDGAAAASQDLLTYLRAALDERRHAPRDDMLSDILALTIDDEPITHDAAVSLAFLLLGAGHETTVSGIGGLLYHVAGDTQIRDKLIADPSLVAHAVEEALRVETPLPGLGRITTTEAVVDGVSIPSGERVMLLWGAANRDPAVFSCPDEFRLDRMNNRHVAFGAGPHRCLGAPLARLEMRVVLEEVLRRMPAVRLVDLDAVSVNWTVGRDFHGLHAVW